MAKTKERSIARNYFVELGKTAKEISELLGVSEQTISKWVNDPKENWKHQRNAKVSKTEVRTDNIRMLINCLTEDRLSLDKKLKESEANGSNEEVAELRKEIARVDDSISKWNKTLSTVDRENRISLGEYLSTMETIFQALRIHNEKVYLQTIDFQEKHINEIASRYS